MLTDLASISTPKDLAPVCSGADRSAGAAELLGHERTPRVRLVSGWGEREREQVWNDGFIAGIVVNWRSRPVALVLSIAGQPYLPAPGHKQEITLYANGWFAGFWRLDADRPYLLDALIEPEWWLQQNQAHVLQVGLLMPNAACPVKPASAATWRRRAFCLHSVEFHPA